MKTLKKILLAVLFLVVLPLPAFASDSDIVKEQNGRKCIDLSVAYEEIQNTSKAVTGQEQSLDSVRKAQSLATLSNIYSFFMGDKAFCVKDEVAAAQTTSFKSDGLLGMVNKGNKNLLAVYPSFSVTEHLASEFIPGYGENNMTFAEGSDEEVVEISEQELANQEQQKKHKELEGRLGKDNTGDEEVIELEGLLRKSEGEEDDAPSLDSAGYTYLKDSLKLDKLWSQSRNIAYLFFVIAMIVIGFMIMFRNKIGGQMMVTITNSIPQLIVCLILVTFSFAIAGIMLDLGRASMKVVERVFVTAQKAAGDNSPAIMNIRGFGRLNDQLIYSFNPGDQIKKRLEWIPFVGNGVAKVVDFATGWRARSGGAGSGLLWTTVAGTLFRSSGIVKTIKENKLADIRSQTEASILVASTAIDADITAPVETAADIVLTKGQITILTFFFIILLFLVVCSYASIKLFITILTTYFKIFTSVIVGPLQIATGAIPGNFSAVENWFKSLAANVLVFPVIITILNVFNYLGTNLDPSKFNFFGNKGAFWAGIVIPIRGIFMFAGYLFASNAPNLVNGFMKVGENKTMSAVGDSVKKSASKIPMLGGMFSK